MKFKYFFQVILVISIQSLNAQTITVEVRTDQYPTEIYWNISQNGTVLFSKPAGFYTAASTVSTENFNLSGGTYTINLIDTYGDGIISPGYFRISQNSTVLFQKGGGVPEGNYTTSFSGTFTVAAANPPGIPTSVSANATSSSAITVSWNAVSGATSYAIDQALNNTFTTGLQTFTTASTSYGATGLTASTTYFYRVRAVNTVGASANSSVVQATTQSGVTVPGIPTGVSATATSSSAISVSWTAVAGATSYAIDQALNNTFNSGLQTFTTSSTSYGATGLTASTTYYYRVRAVNTAGASANSSMIQATTSASGGGGTSQWTTSGVGIFYSNNVHIGKSNTNTGAESGFSLYVANGIKAEKFKLEISSTGGWADYVFDKKYELMPLPKLKMFIEENKHLPGFPSEQQIKENKGYEMGDMIKRQQEALENLHLYILQLEQKISELEKQLINKK